MTPSNAHQRRPRWMPAATLRQIVMPAMQPGSVGAFSVVMATASWRRRPAPRLESRRGHWQLLQSPDAVWGRRRARASALRVCSRIVRLGTRRPTGARCQGVPIGRLVGAYPGTAVFVLLLAFTRLRMLADRGGLIAELRRLDSGFDGLAVVAAAGVLCILLDADGHRGRLSGIS